MRSAPFFKNLQESPVITSLKSTSLAIEKIPFPAITICGQGLIKEVVKAAIFKQFSTHVEEIANSTTTSIANMTFDEKKKAYQVHTLFLYF